MRIFFTTGSEGEWDQYPQRLGMFKTFDAAEKAARELLMSEPSGVIYLYLLWSNCGDMALPIEFLGWRARYRLVRVVSSKVARRAGTPCLFALRTPIKEPVSGQKTNPGFAA
jgi:hypothetical protein